MKTFKLLAVFVMIMFFSPANANNQTKDTLCQANAKPKVKNPLLDWDIIATNTASIPTKDAFSGKDLTYSFTAKPKNSENIVSINHQTGEIHIKAAARDKFDVSVNVKNQCGSASTTFNVIIDEDEDQ